MTWSIRRTTLEQLAPLLEEYEKIGYEVRFVLHQEPYYTVVARVARSASPGSPSGERKPGRIGKSGGETASKGSGRPAAK